MTRTKVPMTRTKVSDWELIAIEKAVGLAIKLGMLDSKGGKELLAKLEACDNVLIETQG